ncbi:MAG: ribosome biogenesis GTP-binding protein YihA/YsxC [Bryobacteraceae bacterium]
MEAEFVITAAAPWQFPEGRLPEVAFLGRSNVGKSSLINTLLGRPGLAFTSSKPGCTQALNFYRVNRDLHFVDLPGYGYAKVSREKSLAWKQLIESYLLERATLALCVMVLDARRGWGETDLELKRWLEFHGRPFVAVATKADKWKNQSEQHAAIAVLKRIQPEPLLFSAVTGRGVRELWQVIAKTKDRP